MKRHNSEDDPMPRQLKFTHLSNDIILKEQSLFRDSRQDYPAVSGPDVLSQLRVRELCDEYNQFLPFGVSFEDQGNEGKVAVLRAGQKFQ